MPLSQIVAASLDSAQNGSAPIYGARAWVNFNGTGTVAIRASGNVSSITDNGTGDYTVNFTVAMSDANYSASFGGNAPSYIAVFDNVTARTVSALRFLAINVLGAAGDISQANVNIFR
jgi:hypothetical protein